MTGSENVPSHSRDPHWFYETLGRKLTTLDLIGSPENCVKDEAVLLLGAATTLYSVEQNVGNCRCAR